MCEGATDEHARIGRRCENASAGRQGRARASRGRGFRLQVHVRVLQAVDAAWYNAVWLKLGTRTASWNDTYIVSATPNPDDVVGGEDHLPVGLFGLTTLSPLGVKWSGSPVREELLRVKFWPSQRSWTWSGALESPRVPDGEDVIPSERPRALGLGISTEGGVDKRGYLRSRSLWDEADHWSDARGGGATEDGFG